MTEEISPTEILQDFLEEYPEDILKWVDYFDKKEKKRVPAAIRNLFLEVLPNGEVNAVEAENQVPQNTIERPTPLTTNLLLNMRRGRINRLPFEQGKCGLCGDPLGTFYSSTLPCGHVYHTDCFMAWDFEHGLACNIEGCTEYPHQRVRDMFEVLRKSRRIICDKRVKQLRKNKEFKKDCKRLRKAAAKIASTRFGITKELASEKKRVLNLHAEKLDMIQHDLNKISQNIKGSDIYKQEKVAISEGRKIMREFDRKYHLGMRDLIDDFGMRFSWDVRWTLERHRHYRYFSAYRAGIRLRPGRTKSWKPEEKKKRIVLEVHTDTESDTDSDVET